MRVLVTILSVTSVLFFLTADSVRGGEYTFEYQKIVETGQPVKLELNNAKGDVSIVGGESDRIVIEAVKTVRASNREEAEEVADHIEIKVAADGGDVAIGTNYLRMINRNRSFWSKFLGTGGSESYGSVSYRISVPIRTSVTLVCVESRIELSSLEGEINIENSSGATIGEYLFGPITVLQPMGDIDLKWIEGDIRIKSTSSKITIVQVRGAIDLATNAGSVNIQTALDSPKEYFVETTSGSIDFAIPSASSAVLNIATDAGEIRTDVPLAIRSFSRKRLVGEIGGGGPKVVLSSGTGDVYVNPY